METAGAVIGALVVVAALAGFVRMLWRPPGKTGGNAGYGALPGETVDGGGHGGGHGGEANGGNGS
jgi:hypothetical protein